MASLSSVRSFFWVFGALLLLVAIGVTVFYHVTVLEVDGKKYTADMAKAVTSLNNSSRRVAAISEKLLLEEPNPILGDRRADIRSVAREVRRLRITLDEFKLVSDTLPSRPYAFTSASYGKSLALKKQSEAILDQADEVLDEYSRFLTFLESYYMIRHQLNEELAAFNALSDLDALAGQSFEFELLAATLDEKATELSRLAPPRGFEDITNRTVTLHREVANGFRGLASSLFPPIDAAIYGAAVRLEELTNENDRLSTSELDAALEHSPIIKSVSDLPEITDRLRF